MGPIGTWFDLIFVLAFLLSVATILAVAVLTIRGRFSRAIRVLGVWGIAAAVYFAVLVTASLTSAQQVIKIGEPRCFDDWCITVDGAKQASLGDAVSFSVDLTVSSRAKRVSMRAPDAAVFLVDDQGRRWDPVPDPSQTPLSVMLDPGQSVAASRRFSVPPDVHQLGLVVDHGTGPGRVIIGDEASFLHKRTVVRLP